MAIWSRLTSAIAAIGIGGAGTAAVNPVLEVPKQKAWKAEPNRILDLGHLAELVAQGLIDESALTDHVERNGYKTDKLKALIQLALEAPPYAEVLDLWRRNATRPADEQIDESQVDHALAKAKIEPQYWPALKELISARLDPAVIAAAIQRGIMRDPGFLPVGPPTTEGKVKAFPVSPLDPLAEAASTGVNFERLFVETALVGNPPGPQELAHALFRQIIEDDDFARGIAEGRTRNEWGFVFEEVAREILTTTQYAESHLRGYTPDIETMFSNMAKHGMSREDAELLFLNQGRPLSEHQIVTGLARGGQYNGPTDAIPQVFLDAVRQSNIKPPYYNLAYANRYSYPSGFQIRAEAQAGELSKADTEQILLEVGWSPKWAEFFATRWTATTAKTDPLVKSQQTRFVTALHKAYVGGATNDTDALNWLADAGIPTDTATAMLDYWRLEYQLEQGAPPPAA